MKLFVIPCAVSWKSADLTHIPADLWPLKRYGTCAQFCVYLFEVTRLDPLSRGLQIEPPSWIQTMVCHFLRGVMKIPRYNTNPKTNALIDCIYHSQAPCWRVPIPFWFTSPLCRCDAFQHLTTHLDAFRQVWHISRYIYFEQDETDPNICNRNGVKNGYFRFVRPYQWCTALCRDHPQHERLYFSIVSIQIE